MRVLMPEENPRKKRRTPPRGAGGRFRKRRTRRRTRRRNPTLAKVTTNPRRRRRRATVRYKYRYRARPKRRYRRRRNPRILGRWFGVSLPSMSKVGFGLMGVLGTQTLPNLLPFTATRNSGIVGYLAELGALIATSTVAGMIGGAGAKNSAAIGGAIRVAYRVAHDYGLLAMIPGGGTVSGYIDAPPTSAGGGGLQGYYGENYRYVPQPAM